MGLPQYVMAGLLGLQVVAAFMLHGKPREPFNAGDLIVSALVLWIILTWGGFWNGK